MWFPSAAAVGAWLYGRKTCGGKQSQTLRGKYSEPHGRGFHRFAGRAASRLGDDARFALVNRLMNREKPLSLS
jgi:hypothetical protein